MKKIGIWLDKQTAYCLILEDDDEKFITIESELEFFNPKGGSRSKTRWGPQDVVQDSKYMEREKHQLSRYFDNLLETIKPADKLALFGPAETGEKFLKYLKDNNVEVANKVETLEKVDSMTENQVKALIKDFFKVEK